MSEKKVVIYTTASCPYCHAAKRLLSSKGVVFQEVDVTDSPEIREKLSGQCGGRTTVPVIMADDKCIGGYQELVSLYESGQSL